MSVIDEVAAERERQKSVEGWTVEHDDDHVDGSLAQAAACYALPKKATSERMAFSWPPRGECRVPSIWQGIPIAWPRSWHPKFWKPKDRRRDLVRAAALIVAEIERLDRAEAAKATAA